MDDRATLPETMTVSPATPKDAPILSNIAMEAVTPYKEVDFSDAGWRRFLSSNTVASTTNRLRDSRYKCFYLKLETSIAGFITIRDRGKVDQLFVRPTAQKRGVARALWEHTKQECLREGNKTGFWVRSSTMAVPVYRHFGFVEDGEAKTEEGITYQLMRLAGC